MQCYTELIAPTGVTHALSLPFISSTADNLVVAKTSVLQIFSVKSVENGSRSKLVMVSEYHVAGTITALSRVKILNSRSGGEAVMIAVRDAKLSLIEWDPELHAISTTSIHYYENEELQKNPWAPHISQCVSHLTVDPSSRCAAFNFGVQNLAILPFHQIGDDLVMDDFHNELDGEPTTNGKTTNGDIASYSTPYASSFVLSLTTLDPGLLHPIDLSFLHEYREPTFGILYTTTARSQALAYERKDVTHYAVFTLDLEQKASTTLLSISKLPNDLYKVIPLPPPVGGALLIGSNELIHVDQGGKTNAIAVNEFARQCSAFPMADNSTLNFKLEGSQVISLGPSTSDLLLMLSSGASALIAFKLDGRTVSGVNLQVLDPAQTSFLPAAASCAATFGTNQIFIGSEVADSLLVGWKRSRLNLRRLGSQGGVRDEIAPEDTEHEGTAENNEDEDDLDDDLYGPTETTLPQRTRSADMGLTQDIDFKVHDRLLNIGPIRDIAFGAPQPSSSLDNAPVPLDSQADLELAVTSGTGRAGGITVLGREFVSHPIRSTELEGATGIWSVQFKDLHPPAAGPKQYDQFLVVSALRTSGEEQSDLYRLTSDGLELVNGTEFDPSAGGTIAVGSIANGTRVVQALNGELRCYDSSFGLSQIHPIVDEDTGALAKASAVSFADPYVLVIREDSTLILLQADRSGDLEECELPDDLMESKWLSGCLYHDKTGIFGNGVILFLLDSDGGLQMFSASSISKPIYINKGIQFLPTRISAEPLPKHWRQSATLTEILVADLGDTTSKSPYMLLRTSIDELVIYEPYRTALEDKPLGQLAFVKIPNHLIPKSPVEAAEEADEADTIRHNKPLTTVSDFGGMSVVFMTGASPLLIAKTASSLPQVYHVRSKTVKALTGFHTEECANGFAYIDEMAYLRTSRVDEDHCIGGMPWILSRRQLGLNVTNLSFFPRTGTYVLGVNEDCDFQLPQEDEWHPEWQEENISMMPQVERGSLKVLSHKSWNVISSYDFETDERIMCLKTLNLEISEETHARKDLIVIGTAITKGEDLSARGCIYIFDIVDVVPEPGIEETDLKLKLIAKEEVKGAVTSLSQVGSQGFLIAAQGQKCMVRGLKEDNTILPVAFLDMNYYVNVIKELKGTGLCILGDACHGLWFTGYSEEPYKLQVFGRDTDNMEVMAADFLPMGKQLYIVSADGDCDLHVFQYDPENPKTSRGTELLHRSTFHTGYFPTTLNLVPRTPVSSELVAAASVGDMEVDLNIAEQQLLFTTQEGAIALITPVSEQAYRRLSTLQNLLVTALDHPCGLNPRAHRSVETDGIGGRAMIDGNLTQRWLDQSSQHQASLADKIGATIWDIRADLEAVGGAGLGYL